MRRKLKLGRDGQLKNWRSKFLQRELCNFLEEKFLNLREFLFEIIIDLSHWIQDIYIYINEGCEIKFWKKTETKEG